MKEMEIKENTFNVEHAAKAEDNSLAPLSLTRQSPTSRFSNLER